MGNRWPSRTTRITGKLERKKNECWDCQDLGYPHKHDYRACEVHKKVYNERWHKWEERQKREKEAAGQKREGSTPKQKQQ